MFPSSSPDLGEAEVQELRTLLRRSEPEPEPELPGWFTARLMHETRRHHRHPAPSTLPSFSPWTAFLQSLLSLRVALPVLLLAATAGAWLGYREAAGTTLHLAEVRYLDLVDPVHHHP